MLSLNIKDMREEVGNGESRSQQEQDKRSKKERMRESKKKRERVYIQLNWPYTVETHKEI